MTSPSVDPILNALIAGAAAALKPTAEQIIKDLYSRFSSRIQHKYSTHITELEADPDSKSLQTLVREDLEKADAVKDDELLRLTKALHDAIQTYEPDVPKTVGVDLQDIEADTFTAEHLQVEGRNVTGMMVTGAKVRGDFKVSDVTVRSEGDTPPKKA